MLLVDSWQASAGMFGRAVTLPGGKLWQWLLLCWLLDESVHMQFNQDILCYESSYLLLYYVYQLVSLSSCSEPQ